VWPGILDLKEPFTIAGSVDRLLPLDRSRALSGRRGYPK